MMCICIIHMIYLNTLYIYIPRIYVYFYIQLLVPSRLHRNFPCLARWKVIRKSVDAEPNQVDLRIAATPGPGVANVAHHECTG